jgi:hypothetical protein
VLSIVLILISVRLAELADPLCTAYLTVLITMRMFQAFESVAAASASFEEEELEEAPVSGETKKSKRTRAQRGSNVPTDNGVPLAHLPKVCPMQCCDPGSHRWLQ